jgi:hypothetical protein
MPADQVSGRASSRTASSSSAVTDMKTTSLSPRRAPRKKGV